MFDFSCPLHDNGKIKNWTSSSMKGNEPPLELFWHMLLSLYIAYTTKVVYFWYMLVRGREAIKVTGIKLKYHIHWFWVEMCKFLFLSVEKWHLCGHRKECVFWPCSFCSHMETLGISRQTAPPKYLHMVLANNCKNLFLKETFK